MRALQNIRWVVFDAVGTLITPHPPVATAYFNAGVRHGSKLDVAEVGRRFHESFGRSDRRETAGDLQSADCLQTSESLEAARWRAIVDDVFDDVPDRGPLFDELFDHFARPESWRYYDDAEDALRKLRKRGYRLGIASNFDQRLPVVLRGGALESLLEFTLPSSQIGYRKPSPRFFEAIRDAAGCGIASILYVGDEPEGDVAAAENAGMPALQIDRKGSQSSPGRLCDLRELLELLPAL